MTERPQPPPQPGGSSDRSRLRLAAGLAGALVIGVAAILLLRGPETEREFSAAPADCVESWNDDPEAIAFGRHQSGAHNYLEVQVLTLSPDGAQELLPGRPGASCAVVFAASALDPEPISAAQILVRRQWRPLSRFAEESRLESLQEEAQAAYNARVTPEGTVEGL